MSKVKKLPHEIQVALMQKHKGHIVRPHSDEALVQAKQDPSYGGALQKAKDTLNNMMEETEHELDTAVLECKEFDEHTVAILDENTMLRAGLGEQVAVARSEIGELEAIRIAAEEAAAQCEVSINTQKAALEILNADLAISEKVENMTQCDEDTATSMLQC